MHVSRHPQICKWRFMDLRRLGEDPIHADLETYSRREKTRNTTIVVKVPQVYYHAHMQQTRRCTVVPIWFFTCTCSSGYLYLVMCIPEKTCLGLSLAIHSRSHTRPGSGLSKYRVKKI